MKNRALKKLGLLLLLASASGPWGVARAGGGGESLLRVVAYNDSQAASEGCAILNLTAKKPGNCAASTATNNNKGIH